MSIATLDEVKRLADSLAPLEQVRLIEHLVPGLARVVAEARPTAPPSSGDGGDAWDLFLRLGERLARSDRPEASTLTAALLSSRR